MGEKRSTEWILQLDEFLTPTYEEWEQVTISSLKGKSMERLFSSTHEGVLLKPIYTSDDEDLQQEQDLHLKRTSENSWLINQELHASSVQDLIAAIRRASKNGQSSIHFKVKSEGSDKGVEIVHSEDLLALIKEMPNQDQTFFIDTNLKQSFFLTGLLLFSEKQNKQLKGVIGSDPIAEWVSRGTLPTPLSFYYEEMAIMVKESMIYPELKTIVVNSQPYHNGGANAVQELAYTLLVGIEYIRQCMNRGLKIDEIAPKISFSFSVGSNLFMEISKLRAARYLWASIIHEFGGTTESQQMWIHAKTSDTTKTKYDPYVNMLRATVESFASVVGGADSLHTAPFDHAFQDTTNFSERIARNVQSILLEESHLGRVIDPARGSWYVESLTKQVAEKAWGIIQQIEQSGGMVEALVRGSVQEEITKVRNRRFNKIDNRQERIVGINMYANGMEKEPPQPKVDQFETGSLKEKKNNKIELYIEDQKFITLLKSELTKGVSFSELNIQQENQKKEEEIVVISSIRWSMKFEKLREYTASYQNKTGDKLEIRLVNIGELIQHKPRTDFIRGFFEVGGFMINETRSLKTIEELTEELPQIKEKVIVLCGDDATYQNLGKEVVALIKKENPDVSLFIAGRLENQELAEYREVGLTDCIHIKTNCYEFLSSLQNVLEVNHEKA
ncbi:methylmalonyl-CoA mutase family protein [Bacillus sp. AK128]